MVRKFQSSKRRQQQQQQQQQDFGTCTTVRVTFIWVFFNLLCRLQHSILAITRARSLQTV